MRTQRIAWIRRDANVWTAVAASAALLATKQGFPSCPSLYCPLTAEQLQSAQSFRANQPVVGTHFFYWYDIESKAHFIDHSADPSTSVRQGAFKPQGQSVKCVNTGQWKRVSLGMGGGRFANRCNGADLRLPVLGDMLAVCRVVARRND